MIQCLEFYIAIALELVRLTVLNQAHILHVEIIEDLHNIALNKALGQVAYKCDIGRIRWHFPIAYAKVAIATVKVAIFVFMAIAIVVVAIVIVVIVVSLILVVWAISHIRRAFEFFCTICFFLVRNSYFQTLWIMSMTDIGLTPNTLLKN